VNFASIATYTQPILTDLGGDDTLPACTAIRIVLGGDGVDTINLGAGDHTVLVTMGR